MSRKKIKLTCCGPILVSSKTHFWVENTEEKLYDFVVICQIQSIAMVNGAGSLSCLGDLNDCTHQMLKKSHLHNFLLVCFVYLQTEEKAKEVS